MILGPDTNVAQTETTLIVVPDGVLNYLPFAVLPKPDSAHVYRPLMLDHVVTSLPSASFLLSSRTEAHRTRSAAELLVVADPVFSADDSRVSRAAATGSSRAAIADSRG